MYKHIKKFALHKRPHAENVLLQKGCAKSETLPKTLRLSLWNCHKGKHRKWEPDFLEIAAQSDIFIVQELLITPQTENLLKQTGMEWNIGVSFFTLRHKHPTGIAIGTRARATALSYDAAESEPFIKTPKVIMSASYNFADSALLVINVHAINFTTIKPFERQIKTAADILKDYHGPIIIAGDFNSWSKKRKKLLQNAAADIGLNVLQFNPDTRTKFFGKHVDYIAVRGFNIADTAVLCHINSSDHKPISALIEHPFDS